LPFHRRIYWQVIKPAELSAVLYWQSEESIMRAPAAAAAAALDNDDDC